MPVKQRARKDEDKQARRRSILDAAGRMLRERGYADLTMAEVARHCRLAKGTLYLYFSSKEAMFLAALEQELSTWFDGLLEGLAEMRPDRDETRRIAETIATSLASQPTLLDLLTIVHNVLEQNIEFDTALSFKQMLAQRLEFGGAIFERALPGLPRGEGQRLLLRIYAAVVGLRQMSDPSPVVAKVLERPDIRCLRVDFQTELRETIIDLVRGAQARRVADA